MTSQVSMERIDYAKNAVETVGDFSMYPSILSAILCIWISILHLIKK